MKQFGEGSTESLGLQSLAFTAEVGPSPKPSMERPKLCAR